jgi:hypothetical protein
LGHKNLKPSTSDYAVVEKPTLETWMQGGLDFIILRDLSIDGIRTIGSVLGQSIALDYYIRQVCTSSFHMYGYETLKLGNIYLVIFIVR